MGGTRVEKERGVGHTAMDTRFKFNQVLQSSCFRERERERV